MTVSAAPVNFTGKDLIVRRRNGAQAAPYDMLAAAKSKTIQFVNNLGETTSHDVDDPESAPWRRSLVETRAWSMNLAGACDLKRLALLTADATTATTPSRYALQFQGSAANGAGTYEGDVWVENLQIQSQNMGIAEVTMQLRGDGAPVWTAAGA
jgi:hypothetical protein